MPRRQPGNPRAGEDRQVAIVRAPQGPVLVDLEAVVIRQVHAKALAGPEILAIEGVVDDVIPPIQSPFFRGIQGLAFDDAIPAMLLTLFAN